MDASGLGVGLLVNDGPVLFGARLRCLDCASLKQKPRAAAYIRHGREG